MKTPNPANTFGRVAYLALIDLTETEGEREQRQDLGGQERGEQIAGDRLVAA